MCKCLDFAVSLVKNKNGKRHKTKTGVWRSFARDFLQVDKEPLNQVSAGRFL